MKTFQAVLALCTTLLLLIMTSCSNGKPDGNIDGKGGGYHDATATTAGGQAPAPGQIHVSPNGSDNAPGTAEQPLRTPAAAIKLAREWRRMAAIDPTGEVSVPYPEAAGLTTGNDQATAEDANQVAAERIKQAAKDRIRQARQNIAHGIDIILHEGRYTLTEPLFIRPEDSGTPASPTVIRASAYDKVSICGGITVTGWKQLPSGIWTAEAPIADGRIIETRQLYVNGQRARRASQLPEGEMVRMLAFNPEDETITIPTPQNAQALAQARGLEMLVGQRWAIAILRVKKLDIKGDQTVVSFHNPESQLEFAHPWPQPVIDGPKGNSGCCLMNALALLDEPGEWFQDYPSGRIYYLPRQGEDMTHTEVVVPVLEQLLTIEGSRERPVTHFAFHGITFEHAAWTRPSHEGFVTLQGGFRLLDAYRLPIAGLPEKAGLENQAWIARPETAIGIRGAQHVDFTACTFQHLGATGLDYERAASHCQISGCTFSDIGGTALMVGAFPDRGFETHVPYLPEDETEICHHIDINGNLVTKATQEDWGAVGIAAGYVHDINITHNEVAYVNYSGICVGWGWTPLVSSMRNNHITANYVHHFAAQLWDAGGIYTLSNQPGSTITRNRIEDLIDAPYATNERAFYIYFDEATDGFEVTDNYCPEPHFGYNQPGPSLHIGHNGADVGEQIRLQAGITATP